MKRLIGHELEAWRLLRPHLGRHRLSLVAALVVGVLVSLGEGVGLSLFIPLLHELGADGGATTPDHGLARVLSGVFDAVAEPYRLPVICGAIFVTLAATATLGYAYVLLTEWIEARLGHDLRQRVFDRYLSADEGFFDASRSGHLINALAAETWKAASVAKLLVGMGVILAALAVYATLLLLISWKLTLIVGVCLVVISWVVRRLTRRAVQLGEQFTRDNAYLTDVMLESMSGMKTIRAFGREGYEHDRFEAASRGVTRSLFRIHFVSAAVDPIYELLTASLLVTIVAVTLRDPAGLPSLLVFIFALYRLQPKMKQLDGTRTYLTSCLGPIREVRSVLERVVAPAMASGSRPYVPPRDAVTFEDVRYTYPGTDKPAIDGVSFEIAAQRTTALVGPSGSGKSTLVKLLMRFVDPDHGSIRVDGCPLTEIDTAAWRAGLALVSQELFVFNASVRDNIAYGKPGASEAEIREAAALAHAQGFIESLDAGYDTIVGPRGGRLSGGQLQRITLARALVRQPDVLILDEATNALDSRSEDAIQQALREMRHQRTMVVIAHRLSTIEDADHVVVVEAGRVREQGPPGELLARDGLFAEFSRLQRGGVTVG